MSADTPTGYEAFALEYPPDPDGVHYVDSQPEGVTLPPGHRIVMVSPKSPPMSQAGLKLAHTPTGIHVPAAIGATIGLALCIALVWAVML